MLGSSFSVLRFSFIGIFELLIPIILLVMIYKNKILFKKKWLSNYWLLINFGIAAGTIINLIFQIDQTAINRVFFDFFSYLLIYMWVLILDNIFSKASIEEIEKFMKKFVLFIVPIIFSIYLYSLNSKTLFGLPLYYYHRFSPLSTNPAFLGYLMYPVPWIAMYLVTITSKWKKIVYFILFILSVPPILWTNNDIGKITLIISLFILLVYGIKNPIKLTMTSLLFFVISSIIFLFVLLLKSSFILEILNNFIGEADGGYRFILWKNSLKAWLLSPIFGLGYGPHSGFSMLEGIESHSVFITILTQGGIIAFYILLDLYYRIFSLSKINPIIFVISFSVIFPGLSGTPLRKITTWFFLTLIYHMSKKLNARRSRII